jgi:hypothetical protein
MDIDDARSAAAADGRTRGCPKKRHAFDCLSPAFAGSLAFFLFVAAVAGCSAAPSLLPLQTLAQVVRLPATTKPAVAGASTACVNNQLYNSSFGHGEFQTAGFEPSQWTTYHPSNGGRITPGGNTFFNDATQFPEYPTIFIANDPLTQDKHVLTLSTFPVPAPIATDRRLIVPAPVPSGHVGRYVHYLGAAIETASAGQFAQRYGYFAARMRFPKGQGMWPAWWLLSGYTEWDIAEVINQDQFINQQIWLWNRGGKNGITGTQKSANPFYQTFDPSKGYHDYGILILPSGTSWYIDGYQVAQLGIVPDFTSTLPEYMLVTTGTGSEGSWSGAPDATTTWPQNLYIQYVRAYAPPSRSGRSC